MNYLLKKSFQRFWKNRKKYAFIILQLTAGTCMMALAFHIRFSFQEQFRTFQKEIDSQYINIMANDKGGETEPLTFSDYTYIREHLNPDGNGMAYYKECLLSDMQINVLFVDEAFYSIVMSAQGYEAGAAYIGENARQKLNSVLGSKNEFSYYDKSVETLFGVPISSLTPLNTITYSSKALLTDAQFAVVEGSCTFEDYLIFPITVYEESGIGCRGWNNLVLSLTGANMESLQKQIHSVTAYLTTQYEDESFVVNNFYTYTEQQLNRNVHLAELLNFISIFILVIVVFGFTGLLLILLNKRRREFSIIRMCGATSRQITWEVFFEILYVVIFGVLLGNLLSLPFLPLFDNMTGMAFHIETLLLCLAGGLFISVFVCMIALHKVRRLSPVVVLKDL